MCASCEQICVRMCKRILHQWLIFCVHTFYNTTRAQSSSSSANHDHNFVNVPFHIDGMRNVQRQRTATIQSQYTIAGKRIKTTYNLAARNRNIKRYRSHEWRRRERRLYTRFAISCTHNNTLAFNIWLCRLNTYAVCVCKTQCLLFFKVQSLSVIGIYTLCRHFAHTPQPL